jgi:hypothetical protein
MSQSATPSPHRTFTNRSLAWLLLALTTVASTTVGRAQGLLLNPSFEENFNETWPHYGSIEGWSGGSGVNLADGPFHNAGTPVPDQLQVAFLQGSTSLSQEIIGLQPGRQYWIQFVYDARNCCGGTIDLATQFNGIELDNITNVKPVSGGEPYHTRSVAFIPEEDYGTLSFTTKASGDATILIDAVSAAQRDEGNLTVINPSFEASGLPFVEFDGLISPGGLAGWIGEGAYGVNLSGLGPYADNGSVPDQEAVAFLQDVSSLSQQLADLVVGTTYELSFAVNARNGNSPRLEVRVGDEVLLTEDVRPVGGASAYRALNTTFTATDNFLTLTFAQTKAGDQTLLLDNVKVIGQVQETLPPMLFEPTAAELAPGQSTTISLTVPSRLLQIKAADIRLRSPNAAAVRLANADAEGILTLHFEKNGPNTSTFEIQALARGVVRIEVVDSANLDIANDVAVNVSTSLVRNSSFESNPKSEGVGYGPILAWTGGSGINTADGPFHDNTIIPDRDQVAFLQGEKKLSQEISGLKPGTTYWLQFRYNARDCCEGGIIDLTVQFAGIELVAIPGIESASALGFESYYTRTVAFVPDAPTGTLEFSTTAQGDATLLLDAVNIIERESADVVVENPSFEASGNPVGVGYIQPRAISGWQMTGGFGVNISGVGPFADNGTAIDQDKVLFMQGPGSATQVITGLVPDKDYTLIYYANARNCCGDGATRYSVAFDDVILLEEDLQPVTGNNPFELRYMVIRPFATEGTLTFTTAPEGDHTFLLDNIRIVPGVVTPPPPPPPSIGLSIVLESPASLRISWPTTPTPYYLQGTSALPGGWTELFDPVEVQGNDNVVILPMGGAPQFFRLTSQ